MLYSWARFVQLAPRHGLDIDFAFVLPGLCEVIDHLQPQPCFRHYTRSPEIKMLCFYCPENLQILSHNLHHGKSRQGFGKSSSMAASKNAAEAAFDLPALALLASVMTCQAER